MNALVYVNIDLGIHKGKSKVARNEKRKTLHGFSYTSNIANFEAFRWNISLSANLLFVKSEYSTRSLRVFPTIDLVTSFLKGSCNIFIFFFQ